MNCGTWLPELLKQGDAQLSIANKQGLWAVGLVLCQGLLRGETQWKQRQVPFLWFGSSPQGFQKDEFSFHMDPLLDVSWRKYTCVLLRQICPLLA